jgi:hypothetical protein
MAVKLKQEGKFEFLYLKDVVFYYASVLEPKNKYQSTEKEYSLLCFITDEDRATLEDEVLINKTLYKVGKDKNKKRAVKFSADTYADVADLNGLQITLNEVNKKGKKNTLTVVDKGGELQKELIGNGSRGNIKCFGYRNTDGLLVVSLQLIQVTDLVPYSGGDSGFDEELGIKIPKKDKVVVDDFDDDDIPFDDDDGGDNPFK